MLRKTKSMFSKSNTIGKKAEDENAGYDGDSGDSEEEDDGTARKKRRFAPVPECSRVRTPQMLISS